MYDTLVVCLRGRRARLPNLASAAGRVEWYGGIVSASKNWSQEWGNFYQFCSCIYDVSM